MVNTGSCHLRVAADLYFVIKIRMKSNWQATI